MGDWCENCDHNTECDKLIEERYKRLAEATFEGIAIHDQGVLLDVNQQFCEMFGYDAEELIGQNGFDLVAPQSREMVRNNVANNLEEPYESFCQKKNGTIFLVRVRAKSLQQSDKSLRVATYRDLTEEKKLQQQIVESERRYKELYDNAQVALFRTALDGTLLGCNKATLEFFGYSQQEPEENYLGIHSVTEAYVDKHRRQQFIEALQKSGRVDHFEVELRRNDGPSFWASISATLNPEQGYIEGALYDITIKKALTKAEKDILSYILEGRTNKEIAYQTKRSVRTVEDHRSHIMQKLGVHNLVDLTKKALSVEPPAEK